MAREATLSVSLTPRLRDYVKAKVASGKYESASEVIRESLRTMQEYEVEKAAYWADVREKIKVARAEQARGEGVDGPSFMKRKTAELKARARQEKLKTRKAG